MGCKYLSTFGEATTGTLRGWDSSSSLDQAETVKLFMCILLFMLNKLFSLTSSEWAE